MKVYWRVGLIKNTVMTCMLASVLGFGVCGSLPISAAEYIIDTRGAHAFIQFRVKHLGYSWLYGRFNEFSGEFTYDEKRPEKNSIMVDIDVASIDSNHAERDKHLRGKRYLNTDKFPAAKFESTEYKVTGDNTADLHGKFTFHGVTNDIVIELEVIGGGPDPWGGYRQGFEGKATINPADYGLNLVKSLGETASEIELFLTVEGVKKKSLRVK